MKRKRYSEEQIISILKQHEAGRTMVDLAREHGIAENTLYRWRSKFGGMEVSEAKRLPPSIAWAVDRWSGTILRTRFLL